MLTQRTVGLRVGTEPPESQGNVSEAVPVSALSEGWEALGRVCKQAMGQSGEKHGWERAWQA